MIKRHKLILIPIAIGLFITGLFVVFLLSQASVGSTNNAEFHYAKPNDKEFFETAYSFTNKKTDLSDSRVVAGIIPHHLLAADMIANFFQNLEGEDYDLVILVGPNHFLAGESDIITSEYDWQTPYGILQHDGGVLRDLKNSDLGIDADEIAISGEHSINSEVAFIKKTFPEAKFLPLILKPNVDEKKAEALAKELFDVSQDRKILVLASADFSHYKTSQEAQEDDKKSIDVISNSKFSEVYDIEVDSPPSIYTILKFSQLNGSNFHLLDNSNSALLADKPDIISTTSYVTGYFGKFGIKMLFVGDLMLDRGVKVLIEKRGQDYILENLEKDNFFSGYDLISANLEGAVTNEGKHYEPVKEFDFAFDPRMVAHLSDYGFTFFNLSNNHIYDQGEIGVQETRDNLTKLGFGFSGCRQDVIADCSSTIIPIKDKKIGMVGLSMFGSGFDLDEAKSMINSLKNEADFVVVNIHWGEEYDNYANKNQKEVARQLIDSGADVIVGHHPHVVQEVEKYKGKPIFYSLGNFIFDQYFSEETQRGLAVSVDISEENIGYELYTIRSINGRLNLVTNKN